MKNRLFSIITAAVCCVGAVPALTSSGADFSQPGAVSCTKGDANLDTKATVADSVAILQHIANRDKYCLSPQGMKNADVDGVPGVTANDALALQRLDSAGTMADELCEASFTSKIDWTMSTAGFRDDLWSRIRGGYSGIVTSRDELAAYLSEICTEDKAAELSAGYDDEFFAKNVLFVNTVSQGSGGECLLSVDSLDIGSWITVNAKWNYEEGTATAAVMSVCVAQVALSKAAYNGLEVAWTFDGVQLPTCTEIPVNSVNEQFYAARVDYTMGYSGFKDAMKVGSKIRRNGYDAVITSTDELTAYLSAACTDEKIAEYTAHYDDAFFKDKVLLMNIIEQACGAHPCLTIDSLDFTGGTLTVNALWNYDMAAEDVMSVCVGVVELDRAAYNGQPVVWTCNCVEEKPLPPAALSYSARTDWYCDTGTDMLPVVWDVLEKGNYSAVITSSAELEDYLSKVFRKELVVQYLKDYEGYFDQCVILMNCECQSSGGSARLKVVSADYSGDRTAIDVTSGWDDTGDACVDMMSVCLQQIKVQKEQYDGQTVNWRIS